MGARVKKSFLLKRGLGICREYTSKAARWTTTSFFCYFLLIERKAKGFFWSFESDFRDCCWLLVLVVRRKKAEPKMSWRDKNINFFYLQWKSFIFFFWEFLSILFNKSKLAKEELSTLLTLLLNFGIQNLSMNLNEIAKSCILKVKSFQNSICRWLFSLQNSKKKL